MAANDIAQVRDLIDRVELRAALGRFATGVAIVTTVGSDGEPVGLTINSFNSVSLEPPLVLWSLANQSPSLAAFRAAGGFAVNVLTQAQAGIATRFARHVPDKFVGVPTEPGIRELPLLRGALASFECRTHEVLGGGDHTIFLGRVERVRTLDDEPLLYYRGRFGELNRLGAD